MSKWQKNQEVDIYLVSKVFKAMPKMIDICLEAGVKGIADSRLENFERIQAYKTSKMLLRLPMISEARRVVELTDMSLNSELKTIEALNQEAEQQGKIHEILLMVDLGDRREGILPNQVLGTVENILNLKHIKLIGLGVNLTCYGGVIPTPDKLEELSALKDSIEDTFGIVLPVVSGGNSSSFYLLENHTLPQTITQLRIGETIVLGRETAFGKKIDYLNQDVFALETEVIECQEKPSMPSGEIGMNAFGEKPVFIDKGLMKRAIVAIGRQDVSPEGLKPCDVSIDIIGASSDHTILDITASEKAYKVGDIVSFELDYGALLQLFTSEFVEKELI